MNILLAIILQANLGFAQADGQRLQIGDTQRLEVTEPMSGVRQQANFYTQELEANLRRSQTLNEKFRAINHATIQLMVFKDNALTQTLEDDGYMELVIDVLDAVPRGKAFNKAHCDWYESDLIDQFEPYAEDEPQEPAVKPGWNALQALCR